MDTGSEIQYFTKGVKIVILSAVAAEQSQFGE